MKLSELIKILKQHGCHFFENGSNHAKWKNSSGKKFTVPRHSNQDLKKSLVENIFKQAGIKK